MAAAAASRYDIDESEYSSSALRFDEEHRVLRSEMPRGVAVGQTPYGYGIFTTRPFKEGETLYRGFFVNIPDELATLRLQTIAHTDDGGAVHEYELNTHVHSVFEPGLEQRQLFGFDGFMNHSCDPTTYSANNVEGRRGGRYDTVARRDIAAGEQITCDYDLFEWDCTGKEIEACGCGAAQCRRSIRGFAFLDDATQRSLLQFACDPVLDQWHRQHPTERFIKLEPIPDARVAICMLAPTDPRGLRSIVALRDYAVGDTLFVNETTHIADTVNVTYAFPAVHADFIASIVASGERVTPEIVTAASKTYTARLVLDQHAVRRPGNVYEYFGIDTFENHSCDPNTDSVWVEGSLTKYLCVATKPIRVGDEITCDYSTFDDDEAAADHGTMFKCTCGAANCRGSVE